MPNELTAIKEPSNSRASVTTSKIPDPRASIPAFIFVKLILGAIIPDSRAKIDLMTLQNPAVGSACPIFDLIEPSNNGFFRLTQKVSKIVLHSISSPISVP
jgi:hypothetical protein